MATYGSRVCDRPGCRVVMRGDRDVASAFPCGHKICTDCQAGTEDLSTDQTRTAQAAYSEPDDAECPICQQKILLPGDQLKHAPILRQFRIVKDILDIFGPWSCHECLERHLPVKRADLRCTDCKTNLCDECEPKHIPEGSSTREHRVVTKDEYINGKNWGEVALVRTRENKVKCLEHSQKDLLYLCDQCKKLNCEDCLRSCSCKRCKNRIRGCDVIGDIKVITDGISVELNDGIRWAEDDMEEVKQKKEETLKAVESLKMKVKEEIYKRHWVNQQFTTFEEERPPDDQLDLIENHISDVKARCELVECQLRYDLNGKRLLKQTITHMRVGAMAQSNSSILLLAFLQFNQDIRDRSYKDEVKKTLEYVTKTKCMYHQNCCEEIEAFPKSVQTGSVQVKMPKVCIKTLDTKVEKDFSRPYIGGITVLETTSNIIISDRDNKCLKCFAATVLLRESYQLPHYDYKLGWRSKGGSGRDIENPGVVYTTNTNKLLGLVDNNAVFEYEPKKGEVKSVKMSPNIVGDSTHNNQHERFSAKVMYQTHKLNAYLSTSIMSDALQSGVVLPQFLNNLFITPWFYFTTKTEKEGRAFINIVISGFEKMNDLDENKRAVVLFLYNGHLTRTVYMPSKDAAGISFNTSDNCTYIADYTYNRVVVFTERGKFVKIHLDKDDGIVKPIGIVFDVQGRLIVAQENGCLRIFQRDDEVIGEGMPKVKPPTYKYFVPAVSSLPPDTDEEPDFNNLKFN